MNIKHVAAAFALVSLVPSLAFGATYSKNMRSIDLTRATSDSLVVSSSPSLDITGDLTLEAWVKFASLPDLNQTETIINKANDTWAGDAYGFALSNIGGVDQLTFGIVNNSTPYEAYENWTPTINTWYHVAAVYSTSGSVSLYVDGILLGTTSGFATSIQSTNSNFCIGQDCVGHAFFDGKIDEVRVYNSARSESDLQSDYLHEVTGAEDNLAAYWQFDKTLYDETDNHNDLTALNNAGYSLDKPFNR